MPGPAATYLFAAVLGGLAFLRLVELGVNARNVRNLLARGGRLVREDGYAAIVAVHAAIYVALPAEWFLAPWAGLAAWSPAVFGAFVLSEALRLWAAFTLGDRWTTRVLVLPESPLIVRGPYRFLRHPIYVAVSIGMVALPLAFGLFASAVAFGVANAVALLRRIRIEERALKGLHQSG